MRDGSLHRARHERSSLTLQELHLALPAVDADGVEALGGRHAALHLVGGKRVENAALPRPVQAQHQDLPAGSLHLLKEGSTPGQPAGAYPPPGAHRGRPPRTCSAAGGERRARPRT